ncbi:MAG: lamin tail domain-containing protein, partial [Acidobacteriota bacterium]|nr:lamin tail domain-containing protein [Acidobacteriota bacterium]
MDLRKVAFAAAAALVFAAPAAFPAISISTATPYTQNFDGMGVPPTATTQSSLPGDFRADAQSAVRTIGTFAAAGIITVRGGGASLSTTAANGIYNFGSGTTALGGSDRAVGFLASGTATTSGNLYAQLLNNNGSALTALEISYNVEKYRGGSNAAGFRIQMFYSTDGSTWTNAGPSFLTSFPADAANSGFSPAPGPTVAVTNQNLNVSIPNGSAFYLAWNYSVNTGSTVTNAQALAVDDVSILGIGATPSSPPATPIGLVATAGNAHVALSWNAVSGATSYNVKRAAVSNGPYSTIASPTSNAYDDTTAVNGTTYFYVVSAANSAGESTNSSEVSATPFAPSISPSGTGSANPGSVMAGGTTTLTVNVTPGANPPSTGLAVSANLSSIGGSSAQSFTDNGNNSFSFSATVSGTTSPGTKNLAVTITDAQGRTGPASIALTVTVSQTAPTGVATATPGSLLPGATTTINVTVTPGSNPTSSGITVTGDLSSIGGSASQSFTDNGDNTFSFTATVASTTSVGAKSLPITIRDADGRNSTTNASLTVRPPSTVKISQVYGGGGNSGSTYLNDFIELYNSGSTPVSLDGWSVQASTSNATSWSDPAPTAVGPPTLLSGTILPGHYYLVKESQGAGGTTGLPVADATGVMTISSTQGKVALVASTVPLSGLCPTDATVVDMVGYGGASCSEVTPTAVLTNTTAAIRRNNGCVDTDNNLNDFIIAGPIPRNSASPVNTCGGDPSQPSAVGNATPNAIEPATNVVLTVQVTPAFLPPSSNVQVVADLTSIVGRPTSQQFYDDGTNGDQTAGDNVFSFRAVVDRLSTTGAKSMVATITDGQGRTATAPITLTVVSATCGVERWSVKVGVDPDAPRVDINNPVVTTIANLRSFPAPADPPGPPDNARVFPWEGTAYTINGTLTLYKKETDVDYHIVIQDDQGRTMVTEIPSPACIITSGAPRTLADSPFTPGISIARGKFDAKFAATTFFQTANIPVRITGVGFFDFIHG